MEKKIAVIGGGAAGMMAAIQAARAGAKVELYERNDRVGKKILATGNGKCNFSNRDMSAQAYYGSIRERYDTYFGVFNEKNTIDFFAKEGMLVKDRNGYLYPVSEQAATVLDILRFALEKEKIAVYTDCMAESIRPMKDGRLQVNKDKVYDAVILACGGKAAPKTGSDGNGFQLAGALGHHVTEVVPALVQLRCKEEFFKMVSGVRTTAELTLFIGGKKRNCVQGELQLTDYGISGIPVFQFSRQAAYALKQKEKVTVAINFLPQFERKDADEYKKFWQERWNHQKKQNLEQFLTGIANKKINQLVIKLAGCKPFEKAGELAACKREKIEDLYHCLMVTVQDTNGFEQAQVSAGGILADEVTDTLESKLVKNLYFAGEILDMDGICGGYNLQWAWTSGKIAGCAAARQK